MYCGLKVSVVLYYSVMSVISNTFVLVTSIMLVHSVTACTHVHILYRITMEETHAYQRRVEVKPAAQNLLRVSLVAKYRLYTEV